MKKTIMLLCLIAVVSLLAVPVVAISAPLDDIYCQSAGEAGWANRALNMGCLLFMQSQGYEGDSWPPVMP